MRPSNTRPSNTAVIGLGAFGSTVATELTRFGDPVLGIDLDPNKASALADTLNETIIADGRDEAALREAGLGEYDVAVVAMGEDIEASILCTMNVKLIGVPVIWAKALNRTHHRILAKLGVDRVILPEQEIGQHIAQVLHNPLVRDYVSLGNGYVVVDLTVSAAMAEIELTPSILAERYDLTPLGLMRAGLYLPFGSGRDLAEGDKLLLLGKRPALRAFADDMRRKG